MMLTLIKVEHGKKLLFIWRTVWRVCEGDKRTEVWQQWIDTSFDSTYSTIETLSYFLPKMSIQFHVISSNLLVVFFEKINKFT